MAEHAFHCRFKDYHCARELTPEEVCEIQRRVNAVVAVDVTVREEFASRRDAEKLHDLRRLPDAAGETKGRDFSLPHISLQLPDGNC